MGSISSSSFSSLYSTDIWRIRHSYHVNVDGDVDRGEVGAVAVGQAEGGSGRGAERLREMPDYAAVAGLPPLFLRKALSRDCRRLLFKAATAAAAAEALREEQLGKAFWVGLDHVIARVPS